MRVDPLPDLNQFGADDQAQIAKIQAACRGKQTRRDQRAKRSSVELRKLDAAQGVADQRRDLYTDVHSLLGVSRIDFSVRPALQQAHEYVQKHRILDVMKILCAQIALERPADMRGRLIELLEEMQAKKNAAEKSMGVFTTEDLEVMFQMWEGQTQNAGEIPISAVVSSLEAMGCGKNARQAIENWKAAALKAGGKDAEMAERGMVDRNNFMKIVVPEVEAFFSVQKPN